MPITPTAQETGLRQSLIKSALEIANRDIEALVQTTRFGEQGFGFIRPLFEKIKSLFKSLAEADFELASEAKLAALHTVIGDLQTRLAQITGYSPTGNASLRNSLANDLMASYDRAYDAISVVLAVSRREIVSSEAEAASILETLREQEQIAKREIGATIASVREVAKETGIAAHAKLFKDEADKHNTMSKWWLGVTASLALLTGFFAWYNYNKVFDALQAAVSAPPLPQGASPPIGTTALAIQFAVAKLIGFSILFSAVVWAGRVYRAHRHNVVVNRHRQNAMGTFEVFVKAASADDQTKNAVLLQATQCIFSPQSTGYLGAEKEPEGVSQLVEVIRSLPTSKA